jgi:periplasmic protein TonB
MLAYAANAPRAAGRSGSPRALALILIGHAVVIGAVMTAKMGVIHVDTFDPTKIINIPIEPPPPPEHPRPQVEPRPQPQDSFIPVPPKKIDLGPTIPILPFDQGPTKPAIVPVIGAGVGVIPLDPPKHVPVRIAAVFRTPDSALRPPYPPSKLRLQEEATLRLRLSIDARGRVTEVEPVGAADPEFLAAARRHIIRSWRYKPATEDGAAVPWSTVITLSFRLENA